MQTLLPLPVPAGVLEGSALQLSAFIRRYFYPAGLTQTEFRFCLGAKWKWTLFPEEKLDTCFLYFHSAHWLRHLVLHRLWTDVCIIIFL